MKTGGEIDCSATSSTTNLTWIPRYRPNYRESTRVPYCTQCTYCTYSVETAISHCMLCTAALVISNLTFRCLYLPQLWCQKYC